MASNLKQQLILSLQALELSKKSEELKDVIALLKKPSIIIPNEGHEKKLFKFIWRLVNKYPSIFDDPHNEQLKNFCLSLKTPFSELKHRPSRKNYR